MTTTKISNSGSPLDFQATFYTRTGTTLSTSTKTGFTLFEALKGKGSVQCAVDPNVIPIQKEFTLILWDDRQVSAIALDVYPQQRGHNIGICVFNKLEADTLAQKSVKVVL